MAAKAMTMARSGRSGDLPGRAGTARRPQRERAAAMRARLMAAAVASLAEHGYAAFSTNDVVRRAGVTRGALFHHFPTRAELLAEAMWWDRKTRSIEQQRELRAAIAASASLEEQLRLAWSHFRANGPTDIEFLTALRADHELARIWAEVRERNRAVEPRYNTTPVAWATAPGDPSPELTRFMVGFFLTGMQVLEAHNAPELPEQALAKFAGFLELAFAAMKDARPADDDG